MIEENSNSDLLSDLSISQNEQINWPDELLEKYGQLGLPSLYDYIITQEKLAYEIRRQNQEIKGCSNSLKEITEMHTEVIERLDSIEGALLANQETNDRTSDFEDYSSSDESGDEDQSAPTLEPSREVCDAQKVLMQSMDGILNLFNGFQTSNKKILEIVPLTTGYIFAKKPQWRCNLETALEANLEGVKTIQQKLLSQLADVGIEIINPKLGSQFNPSLHRAIESIENAGPKGCIAKVIRYGYKTETTILRFSDVAITEQFI